MCGDLQTAMTGNGMSEYISGVSLNECIQSGARSLPETKAVIYESDTECSSYSIKYFNSSICSPEYLIRTDPPLLMDGTTCVNNKYIFSCGTVEAGVYQYDGITQVQPSLANDHRTVSFS